MADIAIKIPIPIKPALKINFKNAKIATDNNFIMIIGSGVKHNIAINTTNKNFENVVALLFAILFFIF